MSATWTGIDQDSGRPAEMVFFYDVSTPGSIRETNAWLDVSYGGPDYYEVSERSVSPVKRATLKLGDNFSYTLRPENGYILSGSGDDFDRELSFSARTYGTENAVLNAWAWLFDQPTTPDFTKPFKLAVDSSEIYQTPGMIDYGVISYFSVEAAPMVTISGTINDDFNNGTADHDFIYTGAGNDRAYGRAGNDVIDDYSDTSFGGNDTLDGGAGNDQLYGYAGNDTLLGGDGSDTLYGEADDDTLNGGSGPDRMDGGAGNDRMDGGDGNDRMDGGAGADAMRGERENDQYIVESSGDKVIETSSNGSDTVYSTISYTLGSNLENLALNGTARINATGNGFNNLISGNTAANTMRGLAGTDTFQSGPGADVLIGGAGADIFRYLGTVGSTSAARDIVRAGDGAVAFEKAGVSGGDRFDFSTLDANEALSGFQHFTFGTAKTIGRLWAENLGSLTLIRGNTDPDSTPEIEIAIEDGTIIATAYNSADFILV